MNLFQRMWQTLRDSSGWRTSPDASLVSNHEGQPRRRPRTGPPHWHIWEYRGSEHGSAIREMRRWETAYSTSDIVYNRMRAGKSRPAVLGRALKCQDQQCGG